MFGQIVKKALSLHFFYVGIFKVYKRVLYKSISQINLPHEKDAITTAATVSA